MTLAYIASVLSSPVVHGPVLFGIIRIMAHFSKKPRIYNYLSVIPLIWLFLCSMTYTSVLLIKNLEDKYPVVHL
jgi:hypothetical protein